MTGYSIRVVTVLLGYLDLLIATSWGPAFGGPLNPGALCGCLPLRPALGGG